MKRTLLISTAVALVLGTGLAAAQDKKEGAAPAPGAQQKAPAEKIAPAQPMNKPSPSAQSQKPAETTGQAPKEPSGAMSPSPGPSKAESGKAGADTGGKAEVEKTSPTAPSAAQSKPDEKSPSTAQTKPDSKSTTTTGQTETKPSTSTSQSTTSPSTTTGQGAAGARGAANLTTEQRTKITTVIKEKVKAQPVTNVNFSISVGTKVPRSVHYYPLPAEVVTIYPAWRGYDFILVGNEIVVIDPATFEIVAVIPA